MENMKNTELEELEEVEEVEENEFDPGRIHGSISFPSRFLNQHINI